LIDVLFCKTSTTQSKHTNSKYTKLKRGVFEKFGVDALGVLKFTLTLSTQVKN